MAAACGAGGGAKNFKTTDEMLAAMQTGGVACSNFSRNPGVILVREEGSCDYNSESLTLSTFNDSSARDQALKLAGFAGGVFLVGPTWAVNCETQTTCEKVKAAIGGTIR